jgi:hypothetical protein
VITIIPSLQADALDFLGDSANYAIRVIGMVIWHALHGTLPNAFTMGAVGFAALAANAASFGLLSAYRGGDANMRSAWVCTRNDVLGSLAVP